MVPEITHPKSISRALNYNENKVQNGQAELIDAGNFLKNPDELNFHEKLERFTHQMDLNHRAQSKVIHISLNFHPSEMQRITPEFLKQLSQEYMEKLGFGDQPYLVYQHKDAAHPHVHIVSTLIKNDGNRIASHNLGREVSEPIRKEMEETYGLVKADKKEYTKEKAQHLAVDVQKVQAGKIDVKRGIQNVLDQVLLRYNYTSMPELNAILKQYNVQASRGEESSRIFQNRGLLYGIIDENDKRIAKPVKASVFYNKPTLAYLETKFKENEKKRIPEIKNHLKSAMNWVMRKQPKTLNELAQALKNERIDMIVRRSQEGRVYGLTYIDHQAKVVFNGSDLGKEFSANRIMERLSEAERLNLEKAHKQQEFRHTKETDRSEIPDLSRAGTIGKGMGSMLQELMQPDSTIESLNSELKKNEEKRRRRRNQEREM